VIDGQGQQTPARFPAPIGGQAQQGDRISAPGQGQNQRPISPDFQPCGKGRPNGLRPVGRVWGQPGLRAAGAAGAVQPMRVRVSTARARTAGLAASA